MKTENQQKTAVWVEFSFKKNSFQLWFQNLFSTTSKYLADYFG